MRRLTAGPRPTTGRPSFRCRPWWEARLGRPVAACDDLACGAYGVQDVSQVLARRCGHAVSGDRDADPSQRNRRLRAYAARHLPPLQTGAPECPRHECPRHTGRFADRHKPSRDPDVVLTSCCRSARQQLRGDSSRPAVHVTRVQLRWTGGSTAARLKATVLPLRPSAPEVRVPRARILLTEIRLPEVDPLPVLTDRKSTRL